MSGWRLLDEGLERRGLRGRVLWRFDDLTPADGAVRTREGKILPVSADLAVRVAAILGGPALEGPAPEVGARFDAFLAGPHGPRLAATRLLAAASRLGATDVHVEPVPGGAEIRLRLAGELERFCRCPPEAAHRLLAALKGLAGCLPYREDLVQEGRIAREGVGADIRASFVPTAFGERAALRLFGRLLRLDELGLEPAVLADFSRALDRRTGLVVVCGPTGAGKTTTLYAALARVASARRGAHLSLEDPVEQRLRAAGIPVDQVELCPERGLTGESMLAAALRQDVDVLAVGELRTPAEASLAVQAAHTGRLVLAGVHAGSGPEARLRLTDLGVEPKLLDTVLRAVLAQELATEPCGCGSRPDCARCGGLGRTRRLRASLAAGPAPARLEVA